MQQLIRLLGQVLLVQHKAAVIMAQTHQVAQGNAAVPLVVHLPVLLFITALAYLLVAKHSALVLQLVLVAAVMIAIRKAATANLLDAVQAMMFMCSIVLVQEPQLAVEHGVLPAQCLVKVIVAVMEVILRQRLLFLRLEELPAT